MKSVIFLLQQEGDDITITCSHKDGSVMNNKQSAKYFTQLYALLDAMIRDPDVVDISKDGVFEE